jgi:hypothetical protein
MLLDDQSTAPDHSPQTPRRWPKRLLVGGIVALVIAAGGAFAVSAFALSGSSIEADSSSLGKISTDTFGGDVSNVRATAVKSGEDIPVELKGNRIVPTTPLHPGEQVTVEATVKRPSAVGFLAGSDKKLTMTTTAPAAKIETAWISVKKGKNPYVHFDQPVSQVAYGQPGKLKHRKFDQPPGSRRPASRRSPPTRPRARRSPPRPRSKSPFRSR